MCVVCNHTDPPGEGVNSFRSSYLCGLLLGVASAEAGGRKVMTVLVEGMCSEHRRLWAVLEDAFERTGTARVLKSRRSDREKYEAACIEAIETFASDHQGDTDPHYIASKIVEDYKR